MSNEIDYLNTKILNVQIDIANAQTQIQALRDANNTRLDILEEYKKRKQLLQAHLEVDKEMEGGKQ